MSDTTFNEYLPPPVSAEWLNDVNKTVYRALGSGFYPDGVAPSSPEEVVANLGLATAASKLSSMLSVKDFGAVGDGSIDDWVACQTAIDATSPGGKSLYWPTGHYRISQPLRLYGNCRWYGENQIGVMIRNSSGSGSVLECDGFGGLGPYLIEDMRIGGYGCSGIRQTPTQILGSISGTTLTVHELQNGGISLGASLYGSGVTPCIILQQYSPTTYQVAIAQTVGPVTMYVTNQYTVGLTLRRVHFEADLLWGLWGNFIYLNAELCTFGAYQQSTIHPSFQAMLSDGNGTLNSNVCVMDHCKFFNSTGLATYLNNGINWTFRECDWTNNVKNLSANNLQNLVLENCYTEGGVGTLFRGLFHLEENIQPARILGGQFNGGAMIAGAAMFSSGNAAHMIIDNVDVATSPVSYTFFNTSLIGYGPGATHIFRNSRFQGNPSDAMLWRDNVMDGLPVDWANPAPVGFTITGGVPTTLGSYTILAHHTVLVTIEIQCEEGVVFIASTGGTSYFQLPTQFLPIRSFTGGVIGELGSVVDLGGALAYPNGRVYFPTFASRTGSIRCSFVLAFQ
jgi:hypothetical protein